MAERIDLSNKLLHFVRAQDRSDENYWLSEMYSYEFGFGEMVEGDDLSAFFILRRILRKLQILSTWSFRKLNRTIYGDFPVVCFTEMPISEFVKSSIERLAKGQKISNYAFIFDKKQLFRIGARPVIYGKTKNEELPPSEKYRYVAFDLLRKPFAIDWTHEREWRWANFDYKQMNIPQVGLGDESEEIEELMRLRDEERIEYHGLNLNKFPLSNIGIILKTKTQAKLMIRDILWLIDIGKINKNLFTYILYFEDLSENIGKIIEPKFISKMIEDGRLDVDPYLNISLKTQKDLMQLLNQLSQQLENTIDPNKYTGGITGISYPCFNDNLSKSARLLIGTPLIKITKLGRYLINLSCLNQTQSIELNEKFVLEVLNPKLEKILDTPLTYYSIGNIQSKPIDKINIDDVPFYTEPNDDEWNNAHDEDDY